MRTLIVAVFSGSRLGYSKLYDVLLGEKVEKRIDGRIGNIFGERPFVLSNLSVFHGLYGNSVVWGLFYPLVCESGAIAMSFFAMLIHICPFVAAAPRCGNRNGCNEQYCDDAFCFHTLFNGPILILLYSGIVFRFQLMDGADFLMLYCSF